MKSKKGIKYTAAKLREKGVLIEVEGLPEGQFKNAQFEIGPTDIHGVFLVKGKFMGVEMETINIDIQVWMMIYWWNKIVVDIILFRLNYNIICMNLYLS